jgi:DNA-binding XRE family transcriptional regulator
MNNKNENNKKINIRLMRDFGKSEDSKNQKVNVKITQGNKVIKDCGQHNIDIEDINNDDFNINDDKYKELKNIVNEYIREMVKKEIEEPLHYIETLKQTLDESVEKTKGLNNYLEGVIESKSEEKFPNKHVGLGRFEDNSITYNHIDFDRYIMSSNLEQIFEKYTLNKSQIASMIGINRATLNNIIKDPSSCSLINAYKLSMTFGLSIEELFKYVLIK